jgi:hypothetical protein
LGKVLTGTVSACNNILLLTCFAEGPDDDDTDDDSSDGKVKKRGKNFDKSLPYDLDVDEDGWPIVPEGDKVSLQRLKDIVRSFLTVTYRKYFNFGDVSWPDLVVGRTTHNKHVPVPWTVLQNDQDKFVDEMYVPENGAIKDPSKMKWEELRELCNFWKKRQAKGEPVFRFKTVMQSHMREDDRPAGRNKGKKVPAYIEIEEPEGSKTAQERAKKSEALRKKARRRVYTDSEEEDSADDGEGSHRLVDSLRGQPQYY